MCLGLPPGVPLNPPSPPCVRILREEEERRSLPVNNDDSLFFLRRFRATSSAIHFAPAELCHPPSHLLFFLPFRGRVAPLLQSPWFSLSYRPPFISNDGSRTPVSHKTPRPKFLIVSLLTPCWVLVDLKPPFLLVVLLDKVNLQTRSMYIHLPSVPLYPAFYLSVLLRRRRKDQRSLGRKCIILKEPSRFIA